MKKILILLYAIWLSFGVATATDASIIEVTGYPQLYFQDTITGNTWIDVDNFYRMTYQEIELNSTEWGFTIATLDQLQSLHSSLLYSNYSEWLDIVGGYISDDDPVIKGFYDAGSNQIGLSWMDVSNKQWAYLTLTDTTYSSLDKTVTGAWVVHANNPVPEPATLVLFGSGLIGLAGIGRRKFKK